MRVLLVAPFVPDRLAAHGGGAYLGALALALSTEAELGLVALSRDGEADQPRAPYAFGALAPYLGRTRATGVAQRLRMLWQWGARGRPLVVAKHWQPRLPGLLRQAIDEFCPHAVMVEQAVMAQYLPWLKDTPTVLTDHEAGMPTRSVTDLGALADRRDLLLWRRYVHRFYPQATAVQALTAEDATALAVQLGRPVGRRRATVPLPPQAVAPDRAPARALFFGDYRHQPNPEAARILARDVMPAIRRAEPEAELWLAGPNQERIGDLAAMPGIRLVGFAPDLFDLLNSVRCLLSPLYSGGGFRIKVLTALAHGLPVITNALGARGVTAPSPACQLAEDTADLAALTVDLLRTPALAATAGSAARTWSGEALDPAAVAREQMAQLRAMVEGRQAPAQATARTAAPAAE